MKKIKSLIGKLIIFAQAKSDDLKSAYYSSVINCRGTISGSCMVVHPENITIGEGSFINGGGYIIATPDSKISIGRNVMISQNCHIRTEFHNYFDQDTPIILQGMNSKDIIIDDDVWVGYGATIMPGVHIHKGAVIGTGAIVTHD